MKRQEMEPYSVDAVIPVYKPDEKFWELMKRIILQSKPLRTIFIMHTMGYDGEKETEEKLRLMKNKQIKIVSFPKSEFDHGGTRNKGAALSDADFVLFMTQDAVPCNDRLVEKLLEPLLKRERAAVSYARQLPDDKAGVIERYTRGFNYPKESCLKGREDKENLGIKTYFCSNVCAMYKKTVYEELEGFVLHTIFNEDMIMASKLVEAGYQIAYAAEARVVHCHKYTYRQQFSRNFDLAVSQKQYREIFEGIKSESEGMRLVKQSCGYLIKSRKYHLIPDLFLQSGFKLAGYKLGKCYDKLPLGLVKKCSMSPSYWEAKETEN